jgi:transposase, IS5 family
LRNTKKVLENPFCKSGRSDDLWKELQRQMEERGYAVKEGSIQDATFITSDPG